MYDDVLFPLLFPCNYRHLASHTAGGGELDEYNQVTPRNLQFKYLYISLTILYLNMESSEYCLFG